MDCKKITSHILALLKNPQVRLIYILILFGACAYYFSLHADRFYALVTNARVEPILICFFCICLAITGASYIPFCIYTALGVSVSYPKIFRIVTLSNLGRYIPGKLFVVGNYFLFSRQAGIKPEIIGVSFFIFTATMVGMGAIISIPIISQLSMALKYSIFILPIFLIFIIQPKVLVPILSSGSRMIHKFKHDFESPNLTLLQQLNKYFYLKINLISFLCWALTGMALYFLAMSFQPLRATEVPFFIATIALSSTLGFIAIFAPAGLGVREGLGVLLLSNVITPESAFLVMFGMRVVSIMADLACGLLGVLFISSKNDPQVAV